MLLAIAACSPEVVIETSTPSPATTTTQSTPATSSTRVETTTITTTTILPTPDLSGDLTWFAPLPPMPTDAGRPYTGSEDFMDLFAPDAPWERAASQLDVFKLYGEWVAYHATADQ